MTRYYSNVATPTTVAADVNNTDAISSITVNDTLTGWPTSYPFTALIDKDTASEEMVQITNVNGTIVTATRAVHGYAKYSHSTGASFVHAASAQDFTDFQAHMNAAGGLTCGEAVRTTTQSLPKTTWTAVAWNTFANDYQNGSAHSNHSGTNWVVPYTGLYTFSACIQPASTNCYWAINFSSYTQGVLAQTEQDNMPGDKLTLSCTRWLGAGSTVALMIYQDSANTVTLPGHTTTCPVWSSMVQH